MEQLSTFFSVFNILDHTQPYFSRFSTHFIEARYVSEGSTEPGVDTRWWNMYVITSSIFFCLDTPSTIFYRFNETDSNQREEVGLYSWGRHKLIVNSPQAGFGLATLGTRKLNTKTISLIITIFWLSATVGIEPGNRREHIQFHSATPFSFTNIFTSLPFIH